MKITNSFWVTKNYISSYMGAEDKLKNILEEKNLGLKNKEINLNNNYIESYLKKINGGYNFKIINRKNLENLKKIFSAKLKLSENWFYLESDIIEIQKNIPLFLENIDFCLENNLEMIIFSDDFISAEDKFTKTFLLYFISTPILFFIYNPMLNSKIDSLYSERVKIEKAPLFESCEYDYKNNKEKYEYSKVFCQWYEKYFDKQKTKTDEILNYIQNSKDKDWFTILNTLSLLLAWWTIKLLRNLFKLYKRKKLEK